MFDVFDVRFDLHNRDHVKRSRILVSFRFELIKHWTKPYVPLDEHVKLRSKLFILRADHVKHYSEPSLLRRVPVVI